MSNEYITLHIITLDAKPLAKSICDNPEDPRYKIFCEESSTEETSTKCPPCRERNGKQFHNQGQAVGSQIGFDGSPFSFSGSQIAESLKKFSEASECMCKVQSGYSDSDS